MEQFKYLTKEDAIGFLQGIRTEAAFNGLTDPEAYSIDMAINALQIADNQEKMKNEIERLRNYNRIYFSKISEYITLFDHWRETSKGNPDEHKYYQTECMKIESWMREERDRVNALLHPKNDPQQTLNFE